jgi:hypothetical protein
LQGTANRRPRLRGAIWGPVRDSARGVAAMRLSICRTMPRRLLSCVKSADKLEIITLSIIDKGENKIALFD